MAWSWSTGNDTVIFHFRLPQCGVRYPPHRASGVNRLDGLWQRTCVEIFTMFGDGPRYREFNFSPSGDWAAYDFASYRERVEKLPEVSPPHVSVESIGAELVISIELDAAALPDAEVVKFNATAVLEAEDGSVSYWASMHPTEKPDFHHRDGFVLTLD